MKTSPILLYAVLMTAASAAVAERGDAAAGQEIYKSRGCAGCHGEAGNSVIPANPSLAGQSPGYLAQTLKDYRSGKRKNAIMNGFASSLEDEDIINLQAYLVAQEGRLVALPVR